MILCKIYKWETIMTQVCKLEYFIGALQTEHLNSPKKIMLVYVWTTYSKSKETLGKIITSSIIEFLWMIYSNPNSKMLNVVLIINSFDLTLLSFPAVTQLKH